MDISSATSIDDVLFRLRCNSRNATSSPPSEITLHDDESKEEEEDSIFPAMITAEMRRQIERNVCHITFRQSKLKGNKLMFRATLNNTENHVDLNEEEVLSFCFALTEYGAPWEFYLRPYSSVNRTFVKCFDVLEGLEYLMFVNSIAAHPTASGFRGNIPTVSEQLRFVATGK